MQVGEKSRKSYKYYFDLVEAFRADEDYLKKVVFSACKVLFSFLNRISYIFGGNYEKTEVFRWAG